MVRYCCVPQCWGDAVHRFPKDSKLNMQWRIAIRRKSPGHIDKLWQPSGSSRLCQHHFRPEDYELGWRAGELIKKLKHGAVPTLNLPKKSGQLLPDPYAKHSKQGVKKRKPPKEQVTPVSKTFVTFCKAAKTLKKLAKKGKWDWNISVTDELVKAVKPDPEGFDQKQYTITIHDEFKIRISCYSWCLPGDHYLKSYDLNTNSLSSFLKEVESSNMCKGAVIPSGVKDLTVINHVITKTGESDSREPLVSKCLGIRSKQCTVLVRRGERVCWACVKKNRSLAMIIAANQEKQMSERKHAMKRPRIFNWGEQEPKCLRLAQNDTEMPIRTSEPSPFCPFRQQNTVPKELWIVPAIKQAERLPESQQQLFVKFWRSQMYKLYATTPRPRAWHYPKELMEFWSDIWQNGKHTYKRLVDSGLLGMPCCSTVKKHIRKKMKNIDKSISEVVTGMSEADKAVEGLVADQCSESISQVADVRMHELTDLFKGQDDTSAPDTAESGDIVLEAVQSSDLATDNTDGEITQEPSTESNSETMDLLIVDQATGTTKKITLPISVLQSEDSDYICIPPEIQEIL